MMTQYPGWLSVAYLKTGCSQNEILTLMLENVFAPNDSIIRLLGEIARVLAENPEVRLRLRGDTVGTGQFVDAILRRHPPIPGVFRRTEQQATVNGITFPRQCGIDVDFKLVMRR